MCDMVMGKTKAMRVGGLGPRAGLERRRQRHRQLGSTRPSWASRTRGREEMEDRDEETKESPWESGTWRWKRHWSRHGL